MIMFWSRLPLIFAISSFPTFEVFCKENVGRMLNRTLGYNFRIIPAFNTVLIWNITNHHHQKMFTPIKYTEKALQFGSEETYLLLSRTRNGITIHYWFGRNTSLIDKKVAAKWAVILALFPRVALSYYSYIKITITREIEGVESESFVKTLKLFSKRGAPYTAVDIFRDYLLDGLSANCFDLYIVRGVEHNFIKKIPASLGLHWLTRKDSCLVLVVGYLMMGLYPVTYSCGTETSETLRRETNNFSSLFDYDTSETTMYNYLLKNKKDSKYKRFIEVLEESKFYNPNEVDNSADHLKSATEFVNSRRAEVSLFDVADGSLKLNPACPIRFSTFQWGKMAYLLDTKSVAGIHLIFSDSENYHERVRAIHLAEEYMDGVYPLTSGQVVKMIITENMDVNENIDLLINLSDFAAIRDGLPGQ